MTYDKCSTFTENDRDACLETLKTTYTLSINDACKMLRCSREWIARYIRPNVKHIRLEQSYAQRILKELKHENYKEQVWFDKSDFEQFILSHMNCTRQTILIPLIWLLKVDEENLRLCRSLDLKDSPEEFDINKKLVDKIFGEIPKDKLFSLLIPSSNTPRQKLILNLLIQIDDIQYKESIINRLKEIENHRNKLNKKLLNNINEELFTPTGWVIYNHCRKPSPLIKQRTLQPVSVPIPTSALDNMLTIKELKTKNESNELLYRHLFKLGYYKLELNVPEKGRQIYYMKPENIASQQYGYLIMIAYEDYNKYSDYFKEMRNSWSSMN